jgi:hypothetical protein
MAKVVTDSDIGTGLEIVAGKLKTNITKSDLGLSDVDNTSDVNKPISTATASAISTAVNGLVENQIVDGVTSKAPSQNAVFDALALKAPLASPDLTGTPTAPTATSGTNTTQLATTAFVTNGLSSKENTIAPGTTSQYFRGDKTWQEFPSVSLDPLEFNISTRTVWNNGKGDIQTNTTFGLGAFEKNTIGTHNTPMGLLSMGNNTEGSYNTTMGAYSLYTSPNSFGCVSIGNNAMRWLIGASKTVSVGMNSGENNGGIQDNSVFIGYQAVPKSSNQINQIVIGHEAWGAGSNTVTLGNTLIEKTVLRGKISIGTTTPEGILDVASTTTGSLPFPRMTSAQRGLINSPAIGTHVYQTDGIEGVYVKKSTGWQFAY